MKQPAAASAMAGPSRALANTTTLKTKSNHPGIGGLPGGVVGPEAAGLDPSGPEHFFVTLAAYADALDALPLDLTRSFSDLRELDAVLGSHLNSLTARLNHLTALIEDPDVDQGQRLLALKEVAEEARAYKMGGEDKIRVALNTAETIISHTDYIDALDAQLDRFPEISALLNPTKHLKLEQYYVPGQLKDRKLISSLENHTNAAGSAAVEANGVGGPKKKKVSAHIAAAASAVGGKSHKAAAAETTSVAGSTAGAGSGGSNSKKRKAISGATVAGSTGTGAKVAKTSASGKGDEDVKSAANGSTSHKKKTDTSASAAAKANAANSNTRLPRAAHAHSGYTEDDEEALAGGRKDAASRRGGGAGGEAEESASRSRSRAARTTVTASRSDDEEEDLDEADLDDDDEPANSRSNNSKSRSRANRNATTSTTNNNNSSNSRAHGAAAAAASPHTGSNWVSRADSPASNTGGGDDADEARYCFCNNVSYGDMIGCDDDDCEREWFHLGCVGLTKPPQGTWYCEACLERRAANGRGGKGKKAKSGGGKSKVRR